LAAETISEQLCSKCGHDPGKSVSRRNKRLHRLYTSRTAKAIFPLLIQALTDEEAAKDLFWQPLNPVGLKAVISLRCGSIRQETGGFSWNNHFDQRQLKPV